ncbi:MAG: lysophospholipid acyltransferase family protein [Acidobacteria bacterium]|nr:lysophospholipid acyltransferase family protein [Acidobacteriota bacterium]
MHKKRHKREYALFRLLAAPISVFPRSACLVLGHCLGGLLSMLDKKHRRTAGRNIDTAFLDTLSEKEKRRLIFRVFTHFGRTIFDIVKLGRMKKETIRSLVDVEGFHHLQDAIKRGNGVLLISAHYGNWEIASVHLGQMCPLWVIARELDNPLLEKDLRQIREHFGGRVIYKKNATRRIIQALRANQAVAILMDQNVLRSQAVFVPFFVKQAATTPAAATFVLRTGAVLLPSFCTPIEKNRYRLEIFPPVEYQPSGDTPTDIEALTEACTRTIENQIRKRPQWWLWMHDRWRSRPDPPG